MCIRDSAKIANETITSFVRKKEFQDWWRTANGDIQFSMTGIHFSHLKTTAWNDLLTNLYIAKLNAGLKGGFPLDIWGKSLTVLLEKEFGSVYFEAVLKSRTATEDFNVWVSCRDHPHDAF